MSYSTRINLVLDTRLCLCANKASCRLIHSAEINYTEVSCYPSNNRYASKAFPLNVEHSHACELPVKLIRWPSDEQVADIFTERCYHMIRGLCFLSVGRTKDDIEFYIEFSTMKLTSYSSSSYVSWIPPARFFTITVASISRRTFILVAGISCSTNLSPRSASAWRRATVFDTHLQQGLGRDMTFVTTGVPGRYYGPPLFRCLIIRSWIASRIFSFFCSPIR